MKAADDAGELAAISRAQVVIEFTVDGEILTANENVLAALGYELSEITGRRHRMFVEPAEARSAAYVDFWLRRQRGKFVSQTTDRRPWAVRTDDWQEFQSAVGKSCRFFRFGRATDQRVRV